MSTVTAVNVRHRGRLVVLAVLAASGFAYLVDAVREHDGATAVDPRVAHDVLTHRSSVATSLAHALTFIGSEAVVGLAILGIFVFLLERGRLVTAAGVGIGMVGSAAMTVGIKLAVERMRPPTADRLGPADSSYSFPSGHTLNSAVALGLVVMFVVPLLATPTARAIARVGAGVLVVGIGASRVYLGYHWTTDVVASLLLAVAWLVVVWHVTALIETRPPAFLRSGRSQVDGPTVEP